MCPDVGAGFGGGWWVGVLGGLTPMAALIVYCYPVI